MPRPPVYSEMTASVEATRRVIELDGTTYSESKITHPRYSLSRAPSGKDNPADSSGWREPSDFSGTYIQASSLCSSTRNGLVPAYGRRIVYSMWDQASPIPGVPGYSGFDRLADIAVTKALASLKGANAVNLSVAFKERSQTANLIASSMMKVAKSVRDFRANRPKDWLLVAKVQSGLSYKRKFRNNIPNSWLEVQYGWNPLIQDVSAACNQLSDLQKGGQAYRRTVRGNAKDIVEIPSNMAFNGNGGEDWTSLGKIRRTFRARVRLDYYLENPALASFASLGLTNPLELGWEVLPYSFVVDWFLPVGDWISSMDAAVGWSFKGGSCTLVTEDRTNATLKPGSYYSPYGEVTIGVNGVIDYRIFDFRRSVYASSPLPRMPRFKNPLSTGHVANAAALLSSAFSSTPRKVR